MAADRHASQSPLLVPVDFSDDSKQALVVAAQWACCYRVTIVKA